MPISALLVIGLAIVAYVVGMFAFTSQCSSFYSYIKQKYPDKLDVFQSYSRGGLAKGLFSSRLPFNSQSPYRWRSTSRFKQLVQADPILSKDIFLISKLNGLRKWQAMEVIVIIVVVATLIVVTVVKK